MKGKAETKKPGCSSEENLLCGALEGCLAESSRVGRLKVQGKGWWEDSRQPPRLEAE